MGSRKRSRDFPWDAMSATSRLKQGGPNWVKQVSGVTSPLLFIQLIVGVDQ